MSMTAAEKKALIAKKKAEIAEIEAMEVSDAPEEVSALQAMLDRLNSPEMEAERAAQLAGVKPDPAAKFRNVVSRDDFFNADKRMAQKRKEFTDATGIEVDDDEDFMVDPPESDAQRAERIKADKLLAETKAAGEKMKKDAEEKKKKAEAAKLVRGPDGTLKPESKESAPADSPSEKQGKDTPLAKRSTAQERMLAAMEKMDGTPTASEDPTGEEFDTAFDDKMPEGTDGVSSDVDVSGAAKAVPVDDMDAMNLFRVVHGGDFDPKSSMDKKKLSQIQENLTKDDFKGLSPNQFALKMYRDAS